jgi:hypothetical protein
MSLGATVQNFEQAARQCSSEGDLRCHIDAATHDLGFDHFALLRHGSLRTPKHDLCRLDSYPVAWSHELTKRGLVGADPVHHASMRSNIGFAWAELPQLVIIGRRGREILNLAPQFGIGDGFTVPANVPGEPSGSCSFAVRPGRDLPVHALLAAEQIGAHAFRAARRLAGYPRHGTPPPLNPARRLSRAAWGRDRCVQRHRPRRR